MPIRQIGSNGHDGSTAGRRLSIQIGSQMRYRVQFFNAARHVLSETQHESGGAMNVFALVPKDWPPLAVRLRVFDRYGCILAMAKGEPRG